MEDLNPIRADHFVQRTLLQKVPPAYPEAAQAGRIEGEVMVEIAVDCDGRVVRACAISGDPLLRPAAEAAAKRWRFKKDFGSAAPLPDRSRVVADYVLISFRLIAASPAPSTAP